MNRQEVMAALKRLEGETVRITSAQADVAYDIRDIREVFAGEKVHEDGNDIIILSTGGKIMLTSADIIKLRASRDGRVVRLYHTARGWATLDAWTYSDGGTRRYHIRNTGHGSDRYGSCEVCGRRCDTVYARDDQHRFLLDMVDWYEAPETWGRTWGWYPDGSATYGHRECLEEVGHDA
jgi:hypothetical protein